MESNLDTFFEQQRLQRQEELRLLNQTSLTVQLGSENFALTEMLTNRIEEFKDETSECAHSSHSIAAAQEPSNALDQFFEAQRAQRLNEVASISAQSILTSDRFLALSQILTQRGNPRNGDRAANNTEETEENEVESELQVIERSQRVSSLLADNFRIRLERVLRAPPSNPRAESRQRARQPNHPPPAPPPLPQIDEAILPPPPVPVGWESMQRHVGEDRVVRNERFDVFAEVSGLLGDGIVTQALNSTLVDILENHLQRRMDSHASVFTPQAREESMRALNNLPRRPRQRNDFVDHGLVFGNEGRQGIFDNVQPTNRRQPAVPRLRRGATNRRMSDDLFGADDGDRIDRLELMIESMQNLLTRQNNSQIQLENAVQQVILNQTLLSSNATGLSLSIQPETAGRCVVCLDESRPVDSAFYKCGHVISCTPCAAILMSVNPYCPLCRQKIEDVIKLYKLS